MNREAEGNMRKRIRDLTIERNYYSKRSSELERRVADLRAALQTLVDCNDGSLIDLDGALYNARKCLHRPTKIAAAVDQGSRQKGETDPSVTQDCTAAVTFDPDAPIEGPVDLAHQQPISRKS